MHTEEQKVFCIGFNKTGTTSLHNMFKSCGLISIHNTEWCHYSYVKKGKDYFDSQCYTDGEQSNFIQLEKWFPNSLFILNTRNKKEWLYSRVKHVMRHNEHIELDAILTKKNKGKWRRIFIPMKYVQLINGFMTGIYIISRLERILEIAKDL